MNNKTLLWVAFATILILCGKTSGEEIRFSHELSSDVGGFSKVQPIFNANVNGSKGKNLTGLVKALNLNGARAFLWATGNSKRPRTPWAASQYGYKDPISKEKLPAVYRKWYGQDFPITISKQFREHLNKSGQIGQLLMFREWGLCENIVFHSQVDGSSRLYPDRVNAYYSAYLDVIKKYAPWVKNCWFQATNEPNYPWWSGEFKNTKESVAVWLKVFNSLDAYIRKNYPENKLIGPCTASSSTFNWGAYRMWIKPVLAGTKYPMEIFNYHLYNIGDWTHLAWMSMFQAEAERLGRIRPQAYVSEINYMLSNNKVGAERVNFIAQHLFTALENPDKFNALSLHLLVYPRSSNQSNIIEIRNKTCYPGPLWYLYRTLSDVRGQMLWCDTGAVTNVRAVAVRPNDHKLVLALFNDGKVPRDVSLNPRLPKTLKMVRFRQVRPDGANKVIFKEGTVKPDSLRNISLLPGEVRTYCWEFKRPLPPVQRSLQTREYFAPIAGKFLADELTTTIRLPKKPSAKKRWTLRLAVFSDDLLSAEKIQATLNGNRFNLPLNQAFKEQSVLEPTCWFFEVPLKLEMVKEKNQLTIKVDDTEYRLMFASIAGREYPDAESARQRTEVEIVKRQKMIPVTSLPVGIVIDGNMATLAMKITNPSDIKRKFQVTYELPSGITFHKVPSSSDLTIPALKTRRIKLKINAKCDGNTAPKDIGIKIHSAGLTPVHLHSSISVYPKLSAVKFSTTPGESDWKKVTAVMFRHENVSAVTRLGWNSKKLFFRIKVKGPINLKTPQSLDDFWRVDGIELFLDLHNDKKAEYTLGCMQLYVCPLGIKNAPGPMCGKLIRKRQGDYVNIIGNKQDKRIIIQAVCEPGKGYTLCGEIPWDVIQKGFKPTSGSLIGLDIALTTTGAKKFTKSILGLNRKNHRSPQRWGILRLK